MKNPETLCDFAKVRYLGALRWVNLWNILLYVFGASVVLFLVTAILLFIRSTWLPGALTTLGTIVSGAGIAWVVKQRTTAHAEEKEAFGELDKACSQPGHALAGIDVQPWFRQLSSYAQRSLKWGSTSPWGGFGG